MIQIREKDKRQGPLTRWRKKERKSDAISLRAFRKAAACGSLPRLTFSPISPLCPAAVLTSSTYVLRPEGSPYGDRMCRTTQASTSQDTLRRYSSLPQGMCFKTVAPVHCCTQIGQKKKAKSFFPCQTQNTTHAQTHHGCERGQPPALKEEIYRFYRSTQRSKNRKEKIVREKLKEGLEEVAIIGKKKKSHAQSGTEGRFYLDKQ